jgi:hypothetical protein
MAKLLIALGILASVYLVLRDDGSMAQCEVSHSHSVCVYSLSR